MVEIVNLRTARKQAARAAKRQAGTEAAARHGQSKANRALHQAQTGLAERVLDGARRQGAGTGRASVAQSGPQHANAQQTNAQHTEPEQTGPQQSTPQHTVPQQAGPEHLSLAPKTP
jgi:hypothetical protein